MAEHDDRSPARQKQESSQSMAQGEGHSRGKDAPPSESPSAIGASQKQDEASTPERPSAGTPDIERGSAHDVKHGTGARDSLVDDPTGAFKERP